MLSGRPVGRTYVRESVVCPSVNTYFCTTRFFFSYYEGILSKLDVLITLVGIVEKIFKVMRSKVKVTQRRPWKSCGLGIS